MDKSCFIFEWKSVFCTISWWSFQIYVDLFSYLKVSSIYCFSTIQKYGGNQFSTKIKQIQIDSGGEYRYVSKFFESLGIVDRVSCPHTQEQNGVPKCGNRVIVEKVITLLAHSSLPHLFWKQAFYTSVYLINRTITPILEYKSP